MTQLDPLVRLFIDRFWKPMGANPQSLDFLWKEIEVWIAAREQYAYGRATLTISTNRPLEMSLILAPGQVTKYTLATNISYEELYQTIQEGLARMAEDLTLAELGMLSWS